MSEPSPTPPEAGARGTRAAQDIPAGPGTDGRDTRPAGGLRGRLRTTDLGVYVAVTVSVLLANIVYLLGLTKLDPFITRSGMSTSITSGFLYGDFSIDPNDGNTTQALGVQALHQWMSGQIPWWNPHQGLGAPLIGEMQGAASFPLLLLQALPAGFLIFHVVLELIGALATARLVRVLGLGRVPAITAGVLFGLQGAMVWLLNAPSHPVPFIPLLLVGIEGVFANGRARVGSAAIDGAAHSAGRRWGVLTIAAAVWLMLTAGFPEGPYLTAMFAILWVIWRLVVAQGFRVRFVLTLAGGAVTGLALASPALLSFVSYLHHADVGGHSGAFAHAELPRYNVTDTVVPYSFGPIWRYAKLSGSQGLTAAWSNIGGYITVAVVFVAVVGLIGRRLLTVRVICAGWIAVAIMKSYNVDPVSTWLNKLPGVANTAVYRYALPTVAMAACLLTAFALDDFIRHSAARTAGERLRQRLPVPLAALAIGTVVACVVLLGAYRYGAPLRDSVAVVPSAAGLGQWFRWSFVWAVASLVLLGVALLLLLFGRRFGAMIACLVLVGEAIGMFGIPSLSAPRHSTTDTALESFLDQQADRADSGQDLGRVYVVGKSPFPNYGSYYDVTTVNVIDSPAPKLWTEFVLDRLRDPAPPNVTTLLASRLYAAARTEAYYQGVLTDMAKHVDGFRSAGVEYVLVPKSVRLPDAAAPLLSSARTTATTTVYRLSGAAKYFSAVGGSCTLTPRSRTEVQADCRQATTLVRRELAFPGWKATVGDDGADVSAYDTYFQSVKVPAGRSTVRFDYSPRTNLISSVLFVAGLIVFLALFVIAVRPRTSRRPRGGAHSAADRPSDAAERTDPDEPVGTADPADLDRVGPVR